MLLDRAVVKRFPHAAPVQFAILDAFQQADWPADVANPLKGNGYRIARERLQDAVNKLNRTQACPRLRFHVLLCGQRVGWEILPKAQD